MEYSGPWRWPVPLYAGKQINEPMSLKLVAELLCGPNDAWRSPDHFLIFPPSLSWQLTGIIKDLFCERQWEKREKTKIIWELTMIRCHIIASLLHAKNLE